MGLPRGLAFAIVGALSVALMPAQQQADRDVLRWSDLPAWPDVVGIGGPFAGVHEGVLVAGGGASFPSAPPWQGGAKVFYDAIFVLEPGAASWRPAGRLQHPLAYCAMVETEAGLVLLGGCDAERVYDDVIRLSWDAERSVCRREQLPALPAATAYCAAGRIGDRIYVLPGQRSKAAGDLASGFWCLDLGRAADERRWVELDPPPFAPRAKSVAVVQSDGFGPALFVFSGEVTSSSGGEPRYEYLDDAWRFDPAAGGQPGGRWRAIAPPPRALAAGSARPFGQSHVLVFSGSRGAELHLPLERRTGFSKGILAYHTITDTWVEAGEMPLGLVTTAAVEWQGDIVFVSGEVRPGGRTPRVLRGTPRRAAAEFGLVNHIVLLLYLAGVVWLGVHFARRGASTDDYFLAGRRVPWWAAGLSIFGTMLSAITFLSVPAVGFATNCVVAPSWLTILLLAPIVAAFYLPHLRRLQVTTAYQYLEHRFGVGARMVGSLAFMLFQLGRMAIVVYLPALALTTFTGLDIYLCIAIIGVLATVYTVLGGIEAVVWTDVVQVLVLLGGLSVALVVAVVDVGGVDATLEAAGAGGKLTLWKWDGGLVEMTTWVVVIGAFFLNFGPYTTDQATVQRYLTTQDERGAARGIWLNGLLSVPAGLLFFGLGIALFAWYQKNPEALAIGMKTDEVLPLFVATRLPAGIAGLVIAGVFAASMSSLDSSMHGIATAYTTDFHRRFRPGLSDSRYLAVARIVTVAMGMTGTLAALWLATNDVSSLFFFFQKLLGLVSSGVAGIFFLGVFTSRSNQTGVLCGAVASTVVVSWLTFGTDVHFYVYGAAGMLTCIVVGYVVSLVTTAPALRTASTP